MILQARMSFGIKKQQCWIILLPRCHKCRLKRVVLEGLACVVRQQYVLDMVPFTPEWTTTDILVPVPVFYYKTMNDGKSLARGKG